MLETIIFKDGFQCKLLAVCGIVLQIAFSVKRFSKSNGGSFTRKWAIRILQDLLASASSVFGNCFNIDDKTASSQKQVLLFFSFYFYHKSYFGHLLEITLFEWKNCSKVSSRVLELSASDIAVALKLVCCIFMTFNNVGCWC